MSAAEPRLLPTVSFSRYVRLQGRQVVAVVRDWRPTAYCLPDAPAPTVCWGFAVEPHCDTVIELGELSQVLREFDAAAVHGAAAADPVLFARMVNHAYGFGRVLVAGSLAADLARRFCPFQDLVDVQVQPTHISFNTYVQALRIVESESDQQPGVYGLRFSLRRYRLLKPKLRRAEPDD
jgi:hypothetical protein